MYPPKLTESLDDSVTNLFASLQRGGDQWLGSIGVADKGDGCTRFALYLNEPLPKSCRSDLMSYARAYLKKCGWKVKGVHITRRYLEIMVSNV